jgi:hypothetical protein
MERILAFVRERLLAAREAPPSDHRDGTIEELEEIEDYILDLMWDEGVDDE